MTGEAKKRFWSTSDISESWWVWAIGFILIGISFIFPWSYLYVYEPGTGIVAYSIGVSLTELILSGDLIVMILVWAFIAGLLICIRFPKTVIIPMGALILLLFYMPVYTLTKLPPQYESNAYYVSPNVAIGYLLAWLALFILGTLALSDFTIRYTKGHGKDQKPSEQQDTDTISWLWTYRRR